MPLALKADSRVRAGLRCRHEPDAQLSELGAALLSRPDELTGETVALLRRDVSFHCTVTLVTDGQLREAIRTHLDFILGVFGAPGGRYDTAAAAATGRSRAAAGVPLPAMTDAYRSRRRRGGPGGDGPHRNEYPWPA